MVTDPRQTVYYDEVELTASSLAVEPLWLRERREPEFKVFGNSGNGPEIVLLHGLFGALSNWNDTIPLISKFGKPVALEFPIISGHRSEVKVKALAVFTEYYIRKNKIAPTVLCGNSLGGHVALRLCLARPELVDCMILTGTSGLYEHTVEALPVRPDPRFIRDQMSKVFYDQKFVTEAAIDEIYQIVKQRGRVLNLIHAARSAKKDNMLSVLKEIKVPTLLIWGEDDLVTTMDVAHTFQENIPGAELITKKKCGHAPMIEYPQWFAEQVEGFVRKHSRFYRK